MQNVLVVGGAGYIGSHTVNQLLKQNFNVTVVDDLSTGSVKSVSDKVKFFKVNILNLFELRSVFLTQKFSAIFHFAAKLSVPESFEKHFEYFDTNVVGTRNLLQLCEEFGVNSFIFSSTAAVYGEVTSPFVSEGDNLCPHNPYGLTKKIAEMLVQNQSEVQPQFKYQILRYFNVAGAEIDQTNGPRNINSGQLILNLCNSAKSNKAINIFGHDFETQDGTAIRDYIHVVDLAAAHLEAYSNLQVRGKSGIWNCGYGKGYSVLEVVRAFEKVNQIKFNINFQEARKGDPVQVVSNNKTILTESNWRPKYNDIELICRSTFDWINNGLK